MGDGEARWEGDTRRSGVFDGSQLAPGAKRLLEAMSQPGWVTEDPEEHLLPHIRRACEDQPATWSLLDATTIDGIYTVKIEWKGAPTRIGRVRADAYALIGSFAESDSHVRQRRGADTVVYDVTTGVLDGDSSFRGHGHLVRLMVVGAAAEAALQGGSPPP